MPRKTAVAPTGAAGAQIASMRPRPDAAENVEPERDRRLFPGASMRPRPDAAENLHYPFLIAAAATASMRPRPDAAENRSGSPWNCPREGRSFNEAAARCRGKPAPGSYCPGRDSQLQ